MKKFASRTTGTSIPARPTRSGLVLVGKRGPAFSPSCTDCDGFDTVVIRRDGESTTVRCTCRLAVSA